jgi:hypothetical protein
MNREMGQRITHIREFRDPPVQFRDMFERDCFDLRTGTLPVLPQRQEFANIVYEEAKSTRLPNETQRVNFVGSVPSIPRCGPVNWRQKADTLVVPNHLGRHAGRTGRFADVHSRHS